MIGDDCAKCGDWAPKGHFQYRQAIIEEKLYELPICKKCQKEEADEDWKRICEMGKLLNEKIQSYKPPIEIKLNILKE